MDVGKWMELIRRLGSRLAQVDRSKQDGLPTATSALWSLLREAGSTETRWVQAASAAADRRPEAPATLTAAPRQPFVEGAPSRTLRWLTTGVPAESTS